MSQKAKNKTSSREVFEQLGLAVNAAKGIMQEKEKMVIALKRSKGEKKLIKIEEKKLKKLTKDVETLTKRWRKADPNKLILDKKLFDEFLLRRFFFLPSNEIYGGSSGFYDFGPPACAIQDNLIRYWKRHFVLAENMLEVDCSIITPSKVFEVSGHVKRFFDWMVKDMKTLECFRVDRLIKDVSEKIFIDPKSSEEKVEKLRTILRTLDDCNGEAFDIIIQDFDIKSPAGNELSKSFPFNLMFKTTIGPQGNQVGYLRPETAQGIFTNFKRLYEFNNYKLPFAAAQVGKSFRNEISPKASILRVREFVQAEIEHFMDPDMKHVCEKYDLVKDSKLVLLSRENQVSGKVEETMTIDQAYTRGILQNKTLCYYLARVYDFFVKIGMLPVGIRFRQHLRSEMAHYAKDCWDAELLTSYGWYEIVGIADRECFDVKNHQEATDKDMFARRKLETPLVINEFKLEVNKKKFFKPLRRDSKPVMDYLNALSNDEKKKLMLEKEQKGQVVINVNGKDFTIPKDHFEFKEEQRKVFEEKFIPAVIEPSFGVGRMIYCLLEHSFWVREDPEKKNKIPRSVLSLESHMAPYKTAILTSQTGTAEFVKVVQKLSFILNDCGLSYQVDKSGRRIGKKYSRIDDIGIPYAITIDTVSFEDGCVTLRERDTCEQIRLKTEEVGDLLYRLIVSKKITWSEAQKKYAEQKQKASELVGKKKK